MSKSKDRSKESEDKPKRETYETDNFRLIYNDSDNKDRSIGVEVISNKYQNKLRIKYISYNEENDYNHKISNDIFYKVKKLRWLRKNKDKSLQEKVETLDDIIIEIIYDMFSYWGAATEF